MTSQPGRIMDVPRAALATSCLLFWGLLVLSATGCHWQNKNLASSLPQKYHIDSGTLIVRSDLKIESDNELLQDLKLIRSEVSRTLELPQPSRPVVIHLFGGEERYASYMQSQHPNLPSRRAFFIGTPTELGVYAHWSPNLGEDLRHEYTHGVLHSCLKQVPLWLDEGLAEYYETEFKTPGRLHREHTQNLSIALSKGWQPDLERLEKVNDVGQMTAADYQESWAWVHYLLNEADGGRELLVEYCQQLRKSGPPGSLAKHVQKNFPDANTRLAVYISSSLSPQMNGVRSVGKSSLSSHNASVQFTGHSPR